MDRLGAIADAIHVMGSLNRTAAEVFARLPAHALTDVTGFGILGHLGNILRGSGVGATVALEAIPLFPEVRELAASGVVPGGTQRTLTTATGVTWGPGITEVDQLLVADAQTSGGLLLCVPPAALDGLLKALAAEQTLARAVIGAIPDAPAGSLHVYRGS